MMLRIILFIFNFWFIFLKVFLIKPKVWRMEHPQRTLLHWACNLILKVTNMPNNIKVTFSPSGSLSETNIPMRPSGHGVVPLSISL